MTVLHKFLSDMIEVERPRNSRGSDPNRFAHLFIRPDRFAYVFIRSDRFRHRTEPKNDDFGIHFGLQNALGELVERKKSPVRPVQSPGDRPEGQPNEIPTVLLGISSPLVLVSAVPGGRFEPLAPRPQ